MCGRMEHSREGSLNSPLGIGKKALMIKEIATMIQAGLMQVACAAHLSACEASKAVDGTSTKSGLHGRSRKFQGTIISTNSMCH